MITIILLLNICNFNNFIYSCSWVIFSFYNTSIISIFCCWVATNIINWNIKKPFNKFNYSFNHFSPSIFFGSKVSVLSSICSPDSLNKFTGIFLPVVVLSQRINCPQDLHLAIIYLNLVWLGDIAI